MTEGLAMLLQALAEPFVDPASRTFLPALAASGLVAAAWAVARRRGAVGAAVRALPGVLVPWRLWRHRSSRLDVQVLLVRQVLGVLGLIPALGSAWWVATRCARALDATLGAPAVPDVPVAVQAVAYALVLFVAWDLSRYLLHRLMHEVPALWEVHQVHHSAEVLTPLTFFRVHPIEAMLYELRGVVVTGLVAGGWYWLFRGETGPVTLLGVHALGLVANATTGNLRHSHLPLGFGRLEAWLVSPAQHQLHHGQEEAQQRSNYGTWLAAWDRLGGSWQPSAGARPVFGLRATDRNHAPDDVVSVLVRPVVAALARLGPRRPVALAGLVLAAGARAEEPPEAAPDAPPPEDGTAPEEAGTAPSEAGEEDELDPGMVVIVEQRGGVPRAAGSAHVIGEEELERWEADDIHRVLARVPGVYVRGEDGFGLRPNIGLRGANSDRSAKITLMEDGILLAPAPYAAPAAYYFPMTTRVVGVEVFKGPAATRHGPHTVGGAINLQTRPLPDHHVASLDAALGMRSSVKVHGFAGTGTDRWGLLLEGVHLGTGGFKELDSGNPTGFERQELMLKAGVRGDPSRTVVHGLELKVGYAREQSDETYLGLSSADFAATPYRRYAASDGDRMRWQRTQAELTWRIRGPAFDLRTTAYHHMLLRRWTKVNRFAGGPDLHDLLLADPGGRAGVFQAILRGDQDSATPDEQIMVGTNDRRFHSLGLQSTAHWQASAGPVQSRLELGLRVHGDLVDRTHTEDPFAMVDGARVATGGATLTTLDVHTEALALAAHAHEDLGIGPVRVLPGVRVEVVQTAVEEAGVREDPTWRAIGLPGLGVVGQATWWLDLFAGVHRGFSPVAPRSPADTRPETSWNVEAGARATTGSTRAEAVGFYVDYDNLTGQCTFSAGCADDQLDAQLNGGAVDVYGVEALVAQEIRLPHQLELLLEGSYTWTGSRFRTGFESSFPQFGRVEAGDALPYVPEHQGALRATLGHPRFTFALGADLRGPMRDVAGQGDVPEDELLPLTWTLDLATTVVITRFLSAYATVSNLADRVNLASFRPFGARPGMPVQVMAGLKLSLPEGGRDGRR